MPLGLVVFADKSHLDLHGSLSTLPIIFTLSCFNERSRNSVNFWRPMAFTFIPNLNAGSLTSRNSNNKKKDPAISVQDEHDCLRAAFSPLRNLYQHGGIMPQSWAEMFVVNLGSTLLLETTLVTIDSLVTTMAVETPNDPIEIASAHTRKWIIHTHNVNI